MADPIIEQLENFQAFRVDAYCEGYPDVIFEIIFESNVSLSSLFTSQITFIWHRGRIICKTVGKYWAKSSLRIWASRVNAVSTNPKIEFSTCNFPKSVVK